MAVAFSLKLLESQLWGCDEQRLCPADFGGHLPFLPLDLTFSLPAGLHPDRALGDWLLPLTPEMACDSDVANQNIGFPETLIA